MDGRLNGKQGLCQPCGPMPWPVAVRQDLVQQSRARESGGGAIRK